MFDRPLIFVWPDRYLGLVISIYRIQVEEAALESALGTPCTRFQQSRKRLIPYVY